MQRILFRTGPTSLLGKLQLLKQSWRCLQTDINWRCGEFADKRSNLLLIGSPGSGKSTVGKILGSLLDRPVVDIDEDILEPRWNMPVAQKLSEIGGDAFLEAEGQELMSLNRQGCVLSLTGSNPMHEEAMSHVSQSGVVVYLDCTNKDIIRRLNIMRVNRIVGQEAGDSIEDILRFRRQFYEKCYDIRIICEEGQTAENIADKVKTEFERFISDKGYVSTRSDGNQGQRVPFFHTVLKGLAEDGGLYTKSGDIPKFTLGQLERIRSLDYRERASRILERLIHPYDLSPQEIIRFSNEAYHPGIFDCDDVFPVHHLDGNHYTLEMFHGPTASFKDGALQLMPLFFSRAAEEERNMGQGHRYVILVATTGDTGGAVLDGFRRHADKNSIGVMVLYPSRGISSLQKHQMTTMEGSNLKVLGVDSDFDFCQTTVKQIFQDSDFSVELLRHHSCKLSAANSLNWGRLLPQVVYHVSGYLNLVNMGVIALGEEIDVCVPTGNFGNILSAYYAKELGVPVRRLICASNSNNALTDFLTTGTYDLRTRSLLRTASPAIDILKSSNLERMLYHLHGNDASATRALYKDLEQHKSFTVPEEVLYKIRSLFVAGSCGEQECRETVWNTYKNSDYVLDPHTAVAKAVANKVNDRACPVLVSGTAHFAKFADSVLPFIGYGRLTDSCTVEGFVQKSGEVAKTPAMHRGLVDMVNKPIVHTGTVEPDYEDIKYSVKEFVETFGS